MCNDTGRALQNIRSLQSGAQRAQENASLTASSSELLVASECTALHHIGVSGCAVGAVFELCDHERPV